jgi:hypothetical protein
MMARPVWLLFVMGLGAAACGGTDDTAFGSGGGAGGGAGVQSTVDAKKAYLGLDASIDKAIALGFAGYNAASSANIPAQTAKGAKSGTMTVGGQVDQGQSDNKTMNLTVALVDYSDDGLVTYSTSPASLPALSMGLKKIPNGTFSGSLSGTFAMKGELEGSVTLALSFGGDLEPDPAGGKVRRKAGTTHVTGTATSGDQSYAVDVTR